MDYPKAWLQTLADSRRDALLSSTLATVAASTLFFSSPLMQSPVGRAVMSGAGAMLTSAGIVSNKRREALETQQKALGLLDDTNALTWYNRRITEASGAVTEANKSEPMKPMQSLVDYWQKQDKHLLVVGGTGDGKSYCVQAIASHLAGWKFSVWDVDASSDDWQNLRQTDCTLLDSFASIQQAMTDELEEQEQRIDEGKRVGWRAYKTQARPSLTIAEEFPALVSEVDGGGEWLRARAKRGRKPRMFFCIVTQNTTTANLGTQGDSKIIDSCFVKVLLGKTAIERAKQLKKQALVDWLQAGGYNVCLVDDQPCIRPQLVSAPLPTTSDSSFSSKYNYSSGNQTQQSEVRNSRHFSQEVLLPETEKMSQSQGVGSTSEALLQTLASQSVSEQLRTVLGEQRWQLVVTEAEKVGLEPATLISEVRKLTKANYSQTAIIRQLWDSTGGKKYTDAKALLIILSELGLTN